MPILKKIPPEFLAFSSSRRLLILLLLIAPFWAPTQSTLSRNLITSVISGSPLTVAAAPNVTTLSPSSATAGGPGFTLTANGAGFVSDFVIRVNGVDRTTTFVEATQLTTPIAAAEIATAGTFTVTVFDPSPMGGESVPLIFTINNPVPTVTTIAPTTKTAGDAAFTLTVNGTNFNASSVVRLGGSSRTTNFVSASQLTAQITAADLAAAGIFPITVFNPGPAGGTSVAVNLTVNNPVPTATSISPTTKTAGDAAFTLTVNGTNFRASSIVRFNGSDRVTTLVSATQLTAQLTAADVTVAGIFPITVFNPTPGGGTSGFVNLTVNHPLPTLTTLAPTTVAAGGPDFALTVTGTNFVGGSVVRFNGLDRVTTFVSATQLTATILASDLGTAGNFSITVFNPVPGGGASAAVNLSVTPSITTISPSSVRAGSPGFTLTVDGAGFVVGTVVRINGLDRSTTFISSIKLTASIPAADIANVGTSSITVRTPAPANLVSNAGNLEAIPSLNNLTPITATVGDPGFTLTVTGDGFANGAVVRWNGADRTTTFISSTKLTASITTADLAILGAFPVTVLNPPPTNLSSNALIFNVTDGPPATECAASADVVLADPGLITAGPSRSQLWRNGSTWWGAFSNNLDGIYFYKQTSLTSWAREALIDTNMVAGVFVAGAPDCLWNGTNLFIFIQESQLLAKLYKYTYNSSTQTYSLISGFPVNLPLVGVGASNTGKIFGNIAIDQDSTGKLWAAYSGTGLGGDGKVRVIWSTSADHKTWDTSGFVLESGVSTVNTEGTAIVAFGGNKIGVAWSNQVTLEIGFRYHNDADPATTWSAKEIIDSGLGPEAMGGVAGKQMSMKAHPDGRLFMVSDDNDGIFNHLHLYVRNVAGPWGSKTLVVNDFSQAPSKPVLLLDLENSIVHVVFKNGAVGSNGLTGQTFITQARMTNPAFNEPCLLVDTADSTTSTSNPTSTKQNLNATTDLVVAASTGRSGNRILVNMVDLTPNALTIFSLSPKEVTAGESTSALTLTVNGKLFVKPAVTPPGSIVRLNGVTKTTTYINTGKLTASIPRTDTATPGSYPVTVLNPDGTVSNVKNLVVTATHPVPVVNVILPNRGPRGASQFTLEVTGSGFRRSSVVRFNGSNRATQFVSDTQLRATISSSDQQVAGPFPVTVFTPTPGGGTSKVTKLSTFYVEPSCSDTNPQTFSATTLFNTNKSQMWYNDNLWWGAFSNNLTGVYFFKEFGTTYAQGALIDGNFNGRPDVLWNGTNLFVLVYEFNTQARLYKYSYNNVTNTYALLAGFPVILPLTGIGTGTSDAQTGSITLAQDSTGKLWATYPGTGQGSAGNVRVIWSTSANHLTWNTTGFVLATGASTTTQEVSNIVHFQGNKIGVAWSNQVVKELGFRYHLDGDPETTWSSKQVIDSGLGDQIGLGGVADNHAGLRATPDGRLFLVQKDSDGVGYIHLYTRTAAGVWSAPVLVDIDPHAMATRPTLLLDLENSDVYVIYEDGNQSLMYLSRTSMNAPLFGPSCPYVTQIHIGDITSTRQNLKASMGLRAAGTSAEGAININPIALTPGSGNVPVLSSVSPTSAGIGSGPFTLTINGSNFASSAVVYFNGMDRATTFVSSTRLTAKILATDIETLGAYPITVMNPKGGTSAAVSLTVNNPVPTLTSITPTSRNAGAAAFTLTVNGTNFLNTSVVLFNGSNRTTTFVSATQLTAQITAADQAAGGLFPITVFTPAPGGGSSAVINLTVNNPVPTLASINPTTRTAGDAAFVLTATGTNFNGSSIVRFNGSDRVTTFVSATQLTAQITAADVATAGTPGITVFNPVPNGGTSVVRTLTVNNPAPAVTSISPATKLANDPAFDLTVNGTNFNASTVVRINGNARTTTLVSATQLTAQITAADVATAGLYPITVFNPTPGGGTSAAVNLAVNNSVPTLVSIAPASKTAGDAVFTLTVNGTNFVNTSVVRINGTNRTTTFVNTTQLTAQLTAADVAAAGTFPITVFNPSPGGGTSAAANLTVNNPAPTATSINPTTKIAGDAAFTLTVNGTNYNASSVVQISGSNRTTTFVNATLITAQISAADVAAAGTFPITVFNPAPGGGTSAAVNLTVNNPVPTATSINPTTKIAGDAAFTLTVNGANYNASSVVRIGGNNRTTTLVSATQLTAQLTAADVAAAGTYAITVFSPAPGGGSSAAVELTVNNPLPVISTLEPNRVLEGSSDFVLTVNGSNFVSSSTVKWNNQSRNTTFVTSTQLAALITAADAAAAATASITVENPAPGGGTSEPVTFAIDPNARIISVVNSSGATNSAITVPITLASQGDESRVNFGITFDTALLSNPQAALGSDATSSGGTLETDASQVAQGRFGITISLPSGVSFAAGTRHIVTVTFATASVATQTVTPVAFADEPVARSVLSPVANTLPAIYSPGTVTITTGYESDVAPRPNGNNNGLVSIADWSQTGRFSSGLDIPALGSEFQRADVAPKASLGNGAITVADWVQAGRSAAGLDPVVPAGGPTGPGAAPQKASPTPTQAGEGIEAIAKSTVRMVGAALTSQRLRSVSIDVDALGGENALGFSLMFDPAKLRFVSAAKSDALASATLNVNELKLTEGRVGLAVALPASRSFGPGKHQVVELTFALESEDGEASLLVFGDLPVAREVVDLNANAVASSFAELGSSTTNPIDDAQYFVAQHYLDFLNRALDAEGLDYWTGQIRGCSTNTLCLYQRRLEVSAAFFAEQEFQETGYSVYRLYQAAFGRRPSYSQFTADRSALLAGSQLSASTAAFAARFSARPEFQQTYPASLSAAEFVKKLYHNAGLQQSAAAQRRAIEALVSNRWIRERVLLELIELPEFRAREFNRAFVLMQYFGYLRRDPDEDGFDFWLNVLNQREPGNYRGMVCSFITSREYQERFSPVVTRTNQECGL